MITEVSQGLQAKVDIQTFGGNVLIHKVCGQDLPRPVNNILHNNIGIYRRALESAGVQIPLNHSSRVTNDGIETWDYFIHGTEAGVVADSGDHTVFPLIVREIMDIPTRNGLPVVALDAKIQNWIVSGGQPYYVDLFPTPNKLADGRLFPYVREIYKRSPDFFRFIYGTQEGMVSKILAMARREHPRIAPQAEQAVIKELRGERIGSYIRGQVRNGFSDLALLYSNEPRGVSNVRNMMYPQ